MVVAPISTVDLNIADGSQQVFITSPPIRPMTSVFLRIPIEHRPPLEACLVRGALYPPELDAHGRRRQAQVMITPLGLDNDKENIYNPSFDVTPAELITAIVTEKGVAVKREGKSFDLTEVV